MSVSSPLLAWYDRVRRDLPWRRTSDPYAIWISEAMLQQTQVATAIPYYERFLARFPTVRELADAPQEAVLKHWEGLGYYSRARNLHTAAQTVVAEWDGVLPTTRDGLLTLPGIGPYMSAAVASIAYGLPVPVLDGNVERVLTRLHAIDAPVRDSETRRRLWQLADALLCQDRPGDHNQAMMELGATICTPRVPDCPACPMVGQCAAAGAGNPESYPVKLKKAASPHHHIAVALVRRNHLYLVVRRPSKGLLGGLWEFPGGRCNDGEAVSEGLVRVLAERFGLAVEVGTPGDPVKHVFTHRRVTLHPHECLESTETGTELVTLGYHVAHRWLSPDAIAALALPRAHQKILVRLNPPQVNREATAHG